MHLTWQGVDGESAVLSRLTAVTVVCRRTRCNDVRRRCVVCRDITVTATQIVHHRLFVVRFTNVFIVVIMRRRRHFCVTAAAVRFTLCVVFRRRSVARRRGRLFRLDVAATGFAAGFGLGRFVDGFSVDVVDVSSVDIVEVFGVPSVDVFARFVPVI